MAFITSDSSVNRTRLRSIENLPTSTPTAGFLKSQPCMILAEEKMGKGASVCGGPVRPAKKKRRHIPHRERPVHAVKKRNERERNRVTGVNEALFVLRDHLPEDMRQQRLSKINILYSAIDYIDYLSRVLHSEAPETHERVPTMTSPLTTSPCQYQCEEERYRHQHLHQHHLHQEFHQHLTQQLHQDNNGHDVTCNIHSPHQENHVSVTTNCRFQDFPPQTTVQHPSHQRHVSYDVTADVYYADPSSCHSYPHHDAHHPQHLHLQHHQRPCAYQDLTHGARQSLVTGKFFKLHFLR